MKRGDLVSAVLPGAYGKPRPVLVVQSDDYLKLQSVTVAPLTTDAEDLLICRVAVEPSIENGLAKRSQIMIDKIHTVPTEKIGAVFGRLNPNSLTKVDRALALFLGIF